MPGARATTDFSSLHRMSAPYLANHVIRNHRCKSSVSAISEESLQDEKDSSNPLSATGSANDLETVTMTDRLSPSSSSPSREFSHVQQGYGEVVATCLPNSQTVLSTVCHKAPVRLIPLKKHPPAINITKQTNTPTAAVCYLSNYGGGLLPGDVLRQSITCQERARLAVLTQGANRIYRQRRRNNGKDDHQTALIDSKTLSKTISNYYVAPESVLVVAPDPILPFAQSAFFQSQAVHVVVPEETSESNIGNVCLIDWYSAGRSNARKAERWEQDWLFHTTKVYFVPEQDHQQLQGNEPTCNPSNQPFLVDATSLSQSQSHHAPDTRHDTSPFGMDWSTTHFDGYASVVLLGSHVKQVVDRFADLQVQLVAAYTQTRPSESMPQVILSNETIVDRNNLLASLSNHGRVIVGLNRIETNLSTRNEAEEDNDNALYMVRLAATSNEDLYRIFHYCLQPLGDEVGVDFYRDRIRAVKSPTTTRPVTKIEANTDTTSEIETDSSSFSTTTESPSSLISTSMASSKAFWSALMLSDSAFPVGSFAYSFGLEAAAQLGLVSSVAGNDNDLQRFVMMATRSTMQQNAYFVSQVHSLVQASAPVDQHEVASHLQNLTDQWSSLDQYAHALLVANQLACRSSLDQGRNLLRVCHKWIDEEATSLAIHPKLALLTGLKRLVETSSPPGMGHLCTVFGVITALLNLTDEEACRILGYCVARDTVSAAVRLNLIGPLASVGMLSSVESAALDGTEQGLRLSRSGKLEDLMVPVPGSCSPVLDALQPSHDLLSFRLFRT